MVQIANGLIAALGGSLQAILLLLPQSPFNFTNAIDNKFLKFINYILPINQAVAHLSAYLVAVAIYYSIRIVLRWAKIAAN